MNVSQGLAWVALVLSLALMFFVALAEVSLVTISRARVRDLRDQGVPSALRIEALLKDAERFLAGVWVFRTLAIGGAVGAISWLVLSNGLGAGWLAAALLAVGVLLLLVQVGGRAVAIQHPTGVALRAIRPLRWLLALAAPLTWLLLNVARRIGPDTSSTARNIFLTEDGLRLLLNVGEEEQFIEADEREMIDSIFRFSETTVVELMVPRVDIVGLDITATLQQVLDTVVSCGHSRIPIYEDSVDKIAGVLYAKDLLTYFRDGRTEFDIRNLMRKPYYVPESAMVSDLMADLQHRKTHLAIVVDEYGGTAGIVTKEDMLEEIVRDIQDEYDAESPLIEVQEPGVYLVSGRVNIDDLNRELNLQITDEDESYTLAGVIYSHLQRVPDEGDTLDLGAAQLEVLAVTDNRIELVRLRLQQPAPVTAESEEPERT